MNEDIVQQELKKLEHNKKAVILRQFLENQDDELSEILLDIIHLAFTTGFEAGINSIISSFNEKTIE